MVLERMPEAFDPQSHPDRPHDTLLAMIDRIAPTPNHSRTQLRADLHGSFTGVLALIEEERNAETTPPPAVAGGGELSVVAGRRIDQNLRHPDLQMLAICRQLFEQFEWTPHGRLFRAAA